MSHRMAAEAAYILACEDSADLAKLGLSLLTDLASKECYLARLCMMYLHDSGGVVEQDAALAQMWANRAKAMHPTLSDASDLYDAGSKCRWDGFRFAATEEDAIAFWEKGASLGDGAALFAICELTRKSHHATDAWRRKLVQAASLGSIEAMVELSQLDRVRGTEQELLWLHAAAALGSLRAKEILE